VLAGIRESDSKPFARWMGVGPEQYRSTRTLYLDGKPVAKGRILQTIGVRFRLTRRSTSARTRAYRWSSAGPNAGRLSELENAAGPR